MSNVYNNFYIKETSRLSTIYIKRVIVTLIYTVYTGMYVRYLHDFIHDPDNSMELFRMEAAWVNFPKVSFATG